MHEKKGKNSIQMRLEAILAYDRINTRENMSSMVENDINHWYVGGYYH